MKRTILGAAALAAFAAFPAAAQQPDAPRPPRAAHPVTRADFQQRLHARFARLDLNHDGFVDRAEAETRSPGMRSAMRDGPVGAAPEAARPPHMRKDPNAMFDAMDANRDGNVSRSEFLAFHASGRHAMAGPSARGDEMHGPMARRDDMAGPDAAPGPMRARHAGMHMGFGGRGFDRLDADHDGRVSLAEADRAAAAMFDRLDANHDGTISPDERGAARARLRERMDERREQ